MNPIEHKGDVYFEDNFALNQISFIKNFLPGEEVKYFQFYNDNRSFVQPTLKSLKMEKL